MGARHRVGIGLLYRPARLHRLAEFIPWNRFRGPIHVQKYQLRRSDSKRAYRLQALDIILTLDFLVAIPL
jgi:hypothetical protein